QSWNIISKDLTTNNPEKQKQHESGGLTMDATGAENNTTILAISPSTVQEGVIWVGTDDGLVQLSKDGGNTWINVTKNISGMPKESWVAQIKPSTYKAGEAFVVVNNYRNFDFKPYLFHTTDYGQSWSSIVTVSQVWNYTLSFAQDPIEPKLLFLGSEGGLYVSIDKGSNWTKWNDNYPNVPTMDLVIHPREHDLVIGTYGRAIYVMDDIRPLRKLAKEGGNVLDKTLQIFDTPIAYITINQEASGTRFGANAIFNGQNRKRGAMISYLINKPKEEKKEEAIVKSKKPNKKKIEAVALKENDADSTVKFDSLKFEIFNIRNEKIRTLKIKAPEKNGVHRTYWKMNEAGPNIPSRQKPEKDAIERGGVTVLPGDYKIRISYGDKQDSTIVKVLYDPRKDMSSSILETKYAFHKRIEKAMKSAQNASLRIVETKEIVAELIKKMEAKDKNGFKDQLKNSNAIKDSLEALFIPLIGKDNSKKQGINRSPVLNILNRIFIASSYMRSSLLPPGATENRLAEHAEKALNEHINIINAFFEKDWKTYREAMELIDLSPFKDYEKLE
ncbi:MAG: hypothetical protein ACI9P5_004742, partial [Saprospiraceae bacterium]